MNDKAIPNSTHKRQQAQAKSTGSTTPVTMDQLLLRWNTELLSLYNKRMQEYWMLPLNMAMCASPDDVTDMQERFFETLRTDYGAATGKLADLMSDEAASQKDASGAYASALLKAQEDARCIIEQAKEQARRIVADAESRSLANGADSKTSAAA